MLGSCVMSCKCCVLSFSYSMVSPTTSDMHERYERLTSVSSSVDFDHRDTVSMLLLLHNIDDDDSNNNKTGKLVQHCEICAVLL